MMMKQMREEEKWLLQMKQLQKQIAPTEELIEKTKKRVRDEDKIYRHVFMWVAVPVICVVAVIALYYLAYARPTAQKLFTTVIQQEEQTKKSRTAENTLTETEKTEMYHAAGEQAGLSQEEVEQLQNKGKEYTDRRMNINWIGISCAKITVTTVTSCVYGKVSMVLYQDKTSYTFARTAGKWKMIEENIEEI